MKALLRKAISWCPVYRMLIGGYWYYRHVQERTYHERQFRSYGSNVKIGENVYIRCPKKMKIGNSVFIGDGCSIDAMGGVQIGNCCALAKNTTILTLDHHHRGAETIPWGDARIVKPVVIEDYVWVGMNASVLPGVTIAEGAIVGLGAVVPRDVPSRAIVVGNPARIVGYRDEKEFQLAKHGDAIKPASSRCGTLWIPCEIQDKYRDLLREVGYDIDSGREYFDFEIETGM